LQVDKVELTGRTMLSVPATRRRWSSEFSFPLHIK